MCLYICIYVTIYRYIKSSATNLDGPQIANVSVLTILFKYVKYIHIYEVVENIFGDSQVHEYLAMFYTDESLYNHYFNEKNKYYKFKWLHMEMSSNFFSYKDMCKEKIDSFAL